MGEIKHWVRDRQKTRNAFFHKLSSLLRNNVCFDGAISQCKEFFDKERFGMPTSAESYAYVIAAIALGLAPPEFVSEWRRRGWGQVEPVIQEPVIMNPTQPVAPPVDITPMPKPSKLRRGIILEHTATHARISCSNGNEYRVPLAEPILARAGASTDREIGTLEVVSEGSVLKFKWREGRRNTLFPESLEQNYDLSGYIKKGEPLAPIKVRRIAQEPTEPTFEPTPESTAALAIVEHVRVDGWELVRVSVDGEPLVRDLDFAARAGMGNPHEIRGKIKAAAAKGEVQILCGKQVLGEVENLNLPRIYEVEVEVPMPGGRGTKKVTEYFLTEEAAYIILMRIESAQASAMKVQIVRVFTAAKHGRLTAPSSVEAQVRGMIPEIVAEAVKVLLPHLPAHRAEPPPSAAASPIRGQRTEEPPDISRIDMGTALEMVGLPRDREGREFTFSKVMFKALELSGKPWVFGEKRVPRSHVEAARPGCLRALAQLRADGFDVREGFLRFVKRGHQIKPKTLIEHMVQALRHEGPVASQQHIPGLDAE